MPLDAGISYQGQNFAPVKPLMDAKRTAKNPKDNPSSSAAFLRELWQGYFRENEAGFMQTIRQGQQIAQLRAGKLVMKNDSLSSTGFVFLKPIGTGNGRDRTNLPLFPQNSETLKAKWGRSRPGVRARNFGDGYKAEVQMNSIDTVIKSYFKTIFTSIYEQRESLSAQDYGTYITQFEYDDKLNQMIKIAPIIQSQSKVLVDGYGACFDCKKEGHPDEFAQTGAPMPQCPDCGSFRTSSMVPDTIADEAVVTDVDVITQGDICGSLRAIPASRWDASVLPHESDWFLHSENIPLRMIHKMWGEDLDIDGADMDDIGFQVMDALAARGGNIEGFGASDTNNTTIDRFTEEGTLRNMWLKPECYTGFKLKEAEKTLAGTIPANVPWEELFPDGLCVRGFNEMNIVIGLHATKAYLSSGVYMLMSHSGIGKGVDDAVDLAKDLNELGSMDMAGIKRYAASGLAIDKNSGLTQANVRDLFRPERAVFVDTSQNGGDINKAIQRPSPMAANPAIAQAIIQRSNMINMAFMTGDFTQGMVQDVDINTFGGQQLAHAKTEEQKGAILTQKTSHREISAGCIYELFTKNIKIPMFYGHAQDRHGTSRGKFISGQEMPKRIFFDAVPDSEIAENKFERRMNRQEMVDKAGGLPMFIQSAQMDPKMTAWYAEGYGERLPMLDEEEIHIVCLDRLGDIQENSEIYGDPQQILAAMGNKVQMHEDAHMDKAAFLCKILDDDEVQTWSPNAVAAVNLLITTHYELEGQAQLEKEMIKQKVMNMLAASQQDANRAIMAPDVQAQQDQAAQEQTAGALQDVAGRVLDDEQAQVDADRAKESSEADHSRGEEAAEAADQRSERSKQNDHVRNMQMERHKAALSPAPAKPAASRGK